MRCETSKRSERTHRIFVSSVAGVDDPGLIRIRTDVGRPVGDTGGYRQTPLDGPQRRGFQDGARRGGGEVVVVGQREIEVVVVEQLESLDRLVLTDHELDLWMALRELGDDRQEGYADAGGEAADTNGAGRVGIGIEVEAGTVDGGQNRDRVVCKPSSGRRQADPPAF